MTSLNQEESKGNHVRRLAECLQLANATLEESWGREATLKIILCSEKA